MTWGPTPWTGLTPARPDATPARPDITLARNPITHGTPAQAYGHPNFVVDVPVQGPTDEGMRAGSCWWAQNRLPARPHCVDCQEKGNVMVPGWSRSSMACPGCGMLGESVLFGGKAAYGFALAQAAPDVFDSLNAAQQIWVRDALVMLNTFISSTTGSSCPVWQDPRTNPLNGAAMCFQQWYNSIASSQGIAPIRTDGVFDEATLCALSMATNVWHSADFTQAFPDPMGQHCQAAAPPAPAPGPTPAPTDITPTPTPGTPTAAGAQKGLSTGAMVGIGVAGAAALGSIIYVATRKSGGGRRRRRR